MGSAGRFLRFSYARSVVNLAVFDEIACSQGLRTDGVAKHEFSVLVMVMIMAHSQA